RETPGEVFDHLQFTVQDEADVQRVVLAWRAWATLDLTGREHAHTLLRQSVRYCLHDDGMLAPGHRSREIQTLLPRLLDQYRLLGRPPGQRTADDAWVERLSLTILKGTPEQGADAAAAALGEGFAPEAVGEAVSLAANELVLRQRGGRAHGDSVGVHASDSANAWRNIARVSNPRNAVASLIVGAYHTAGQLQWGDVPPYPLPK